MLKRILIGLAVIVSVLAALAFLEVQGHQAHVAKHMVGEAMSPLLDSREEVVEFYVVHGRLPNDAAEAKLKPRATKYVDVRYSAGELQAVFRDGPGVGKYAGKAVSFKAEVTREGFSWRCHAEGFPADALPVYCRRR